MPATKLAVIVKQLSAYGLEVSMQAPDASSFAMRGQVVTLQRGEQRAQFSIRQDFTDSTELFGDSGDRPLVIQKHIGVTRSAEYRQQGLNYVDEAGNAYITFDDVYIDVRGKPAVKGRRTRSVGGQVNSSARVNLFSAKRARVIFALLTWPELSGATVREISTAAGVSVGLVQETISQLNLDGFLSRGAEPRLLRERQLFELWALTYPQQLAPTLALQSFRAPSIVQPELGANVELGGENAVPELIRPASLTVYVREFSPRMAGANRWRRDDNPNVFVRQKFWTEPALLDMEALNSSNSFATVPSTLIYADLLASGEPRQREVAETFRNLDDRLLRISRS